MEGNSRGNKQVMTLKTSQRRKFHRTKQTKSKREWENEGLLCNFKADIYCQGNQFLWGNRVLCWNFGLWGVQGYLLAEIPRSGYIDTGDVSTPCTYSEDLALEGLAKLNLWVRVNIPRRKAESSYLRMQSACKKEKGRVSKETRSGGEAHSGAEEKVCVCRAEGGQAVQTRRRRDRSIQAARGLWQWEWSLLMEWSWQKPDLKGGWVSWTCACNWQ